MGVFLLAGLLSTYASLFELGDSLADIKTRADLFDYLRMVSARARDLQPSSSSYLVEETAEVKLLAGASLSPMPCRGGSFGGVRWPQGVDADFKRRRAAPIPREGDG